jgi:hypothetical protein
LVYLVRDPEVKRGPDGAVLPSFDRLAVLRASGQTILDEGPPGSISAVRIDGAVIRWTSGGQAREAPLG